MTEQQMQEEYNRLVLLLGTALVNRIVYLSSEIQKQQQAAQCLKPKDPPPDTK